MKVCIAGINGRMGSFVYNILEKRTGFEIVCGISNSNNSFKDLKIYESLEDAMLNHEIDLLVDFTEGEACIDLITRSLNNNIKVISGTTGLRQEALQELIKISQEKEATFVHVPNFAKGASEVYSILENIHDEHKEIDIIETHHKKKKDRPSGTAIEFAKALNKENVSIESVRLNEFIASHEIIMSNPGEKIIIRHEISHRDAFLRGFLETIEKVKVKPYFLLIGLKDFYKKY